METNQKDKQKKLLTAALVVGIILIVFSLLQFVFLKLEMKEMEKDLRELRSIITSEQTNITEDYNSVSSSDAQQAASTAILSEVPEDGKSKEPDVKHKVYLTFDDGPSKQTEVILDILDEYGVKATFFVVGKDGENVKERLKMIYERGHSIGMHSYSHDYADIYDSMEAFRADFLKSKQYIYEATGVETKYFRFPGGSSNTLGKIDMNEVVEFLQEQGVEYYDWNISSGDGGGTLMPADVIVENCTEDILRYETSIILMHDSAGKTTTVEALPQIIEAIQAMEDTAILPITQASKPIHHVIKPRETEETEKKEVTREEKEISK